MLPVLCVAQCEWNCLFTCAPFCVASIYLHVFVNHSWRKVRIASGAQALIKEGACMWAWDWAWVGEGLLGEHEIQGMDLAVHEYVPVQSCICGKWSHCIICISPPVVSDPGFGRRIGRSEEGEKKMEAEISAAQWKKLLLSWALVWAATWLILADYYSGGEALALRRRKKKMDILSVLFMIHLNLFHFSCIQISHAYFMFHTFESSKQMWLCKHLFLTWRILLSVSVTPLFFQRICSIFNLQQEQISICLMKNLFRLHRDSCRDLILLKQHY